MRILFIGDIVGRPGRIALKRWLPKLRREFAVDIVVVNAENAAGGLGVTPEILDELFQQGVQAVTLGNHTWRKKAMIKAINDYDNVLRPLNFPKASPGRGSAVISLDDGRKLGLVNAIGRIYMESADCPFEKTEEAVVELRRETNTILVDMHAEATSEKCAMGWFLDGRCTAVVGTHTHVQTADERVLPGGTAYISDVGMTGPRDSVIGVERSIVIHKFRTGLPASFDVAKEPAMVNGVVIESNDDTGKAKSIERVFRL